MKKILLKEIHGIWREIFLTDQYPNKPEHINHPWRIAENQTGFFEAYGTGKPFLDFIQEYPGCARIETMYSSEKSRFLFYFQRSEFDSHFKIDPQTEVVHCRLGVSLSTGDCSYNIVLLNPASGHYLCFGYDE